MIGYRLMRVGILALLHESNTFLPRPATLEDFRRDVLLTGEDVRKRFRDANHEVGGFFSGLEHEGVEAVPVFAARAVPSGTIERSAFEELLRILDGQLATAGRLDGVLAAPHGATVSEREPDADGAWLGRVRRRLGPDAPIVGTLDPHANLSPAMVEACDALLSYRTNPHLDQVERGIEAARLMARTLRGEVRPKMAAAFPPMAVNIEAQSTDGDPCRSLLERIREAEGGEGVLSASLLLGFPYADVAEMGSSVVVVADGSEERARSAAAALGGLLWERRKELAGRLVPVDEALDRAERAEGPVCLLDMGDNVGGGSPGDSTVLIHAIRKRGIPGAFACLYDPEAAGKAEAGATMRLRVGGKTDRHHGAPVEGTFTVESVHDGRFREPEVRHGGFGTFDQGRTAVVRDAAGLTLMITSHRVPPFSLRQLTAFGIDPGAFRVLVVKGVHAPVAAYREACREFIRVNTPGATCADLSAFEFRRRRRPMYPFEPDTSWSPS